MQHSKALLVSSVLAVACASLVATVSRGPATFVKMEKFNADPDATYEKDRDSRVAAVGANEGGPLAAEEEKYANRAFPGTDVPFAATIAARAAFDAAAARGVGNAAGAWSLYGPSTSTMPGTLSFYGGGPSATYVTSGRITALAIAPTCTASNCRVWVGAAGGGIWITDKALAGAQNWRFVSEELGTNAIGSLLLDPTDRTGNAFLDNRRRRSRYSVLAIPAERVGSYSCSGCRRRDVDIGRNARVRTSSTSVGMAAMPTGLRRVRPSSPPDLVNRRNRRVARAWGAGTVSAPPLVGQSRPHEGWVP